MPYMRLDENHPVVKKLESVFSLMESLKLEIYVRCSSLMVVSDGQTYELMDSEADPRDSIISPEIPPGIEYKLCYLKE